MSTVAGFRSPNRLGSTLPLLATLSVLSVFAACGSDKIEDGGGSGQPNVNALSGGLAIVSSDYAVTSVATYDPATGRLVDDCVHSGVTGAILAQALSGDVVLPSAPQQGGELVVIDRKNAVLTFVAPASCAPRVQLSVSTGGFKSNPHDVVGISAHKAYVTRYDTNVAPTSDPSDFDEGDDLLVIDPATPKILGRVALSGYATRVTGATIQAKPDRAVLAGGLVYVTLNNLANDFSAAGAGRLAVIDPATDTVRSVIDLPNQTGCSGITYVATTKKLYVSCGGESSDLPDQLAKSALVEIDMSGAAPVLARIIPASALGNQPVGYAASAVLGETAFVTTPGSFDLTGAMLTSDAFYSVPLGGGGIGAVKLLDGGAYNLGQPVADAVSHKVLLPDGDAVRPRVRIVDASSAVVVLGSPFEANPAGHLPPREAARY